MLTDDDTSYQSELTSVPFSIESVLVHKVLHQFKDLKGLINHSKQSELVQFLLPTNLLHNSE